MLFDSHAHYNDRAFDSDRYDVLDNMKTNNIGYIMNVADSMQSIERILAISEKYPFVYMSVGVHPEEVGELTEDDMNILKEYTKMQKVRAIGEIGLDYHYDDVPRDIQKTWFARQIQLAKEVMLPIIVHDRDAHSDTIEIIKNTNISEIGGVLHCYSGSAEMAKEVLALGMYFGFGGTLTFKNAKKVQKAAEDVPIEKIVLETDCPYLAPEPHRGSRNSSLFMHHVAEKLAEIKGMAVSDVERITTENAKRLYKIEE